MFLRLSRDCCTYRSTKSTDCIPASKGGETGSTATDGRSAGDIRKGRVGALVEEGIEEPKRWLASCDQSIVDQGGHGSSARSGGTGTIKQNVHSEPRHYIALSLSRDIRVAPTAGVVQTSELRSKLIDVGLDSQVLVSWTLEVVAETSTARETIGIEGNDLGVEVLGGADDGDEGASSRERWNEHGRVLAIIALAVGRILRSYTRVT